MGVNEVKSEPRKNYFLYAFTGALVAVMAVTWFMASYAVTTPVSGVTITSSGGIVNGTSGSNGGQFVNPNGSGVDKQQEQQQQVPVIVLGGAQNPPTVAPAPQPQSITQQVIPPSPTFTQVRPVSISEPGIVLDNEILLTDCETVIAEKIFDKVVHDHSLDSPKAITFAQIIESDKLTLDDKLILNSLDLHDLSPAKKLFFNQVLNEDEMLLKKKLIFNAVHELDHHNFHDFDHDLHLGSGLKFSDVLHELCGTHIDQ